MTNSGKKYGGSGEGIEIGNNKLDSETKKQGKSTKRWEYNRAKKWIPYQKEIRV